jgi:aryl-alcohol dehydrogenase-like predicted oxidoreductase
MTTVTPISQPIDRPLGRQGFGSMRLRPGPPSTDDRDPVAVLQAALDLGIAMIDTADAYQNEEQVGRAIAARRDEVMLATKFGLVWTAGVAGDFRVRADPEYVQQACERSLRRLGADVIDLYYLHHRSDRVPIEATVTAMAGLVAEGKVVRLGLSNVTPEDLRRAVAVHPIAALQHEWSLAERDLERELLAVARELGVTVVAHSPTRHGDLQGGASAGGAARNGLAGTLQRMAADHDASPGQIALAWVHHRERVHRVSVVPLPGTTSVAHLRANVAAADITLSDDELRQLDVASDPITESGKPGVGSTSTSDQ